MKFKALLSAAALVALSAGAAHAQTTDDVVKIGVLNDQASVYADIGGKGSVIAAQMAAADFGKVLGKPVEVVFADNQNKADIAMTVGGRWYDNDKVDVIIDGAASSSSLAINELTRNKNKVFLANGPATSDLTGPACSPNTVHYAYDTWALAHGTGDAVVKAGGKSWYFLTADYAFGYALERDTGEVVKAAGGTVVGAVRAPINTSDFSSFLLQAQASKAQIIGLANAGADATNSIKQAAEFGIVQGGQKLAGLLVFISDVHSLGLQTAQGLQLTEAFYWDLNDKTREFSKRFQEKMGRPPTMVQAASYSEVMHYLKAVQALGSDADGKKVMDKMKEIPVADGLFDGPIRADGRKIHDMYLFEVKKPSESKAQWDYYKMVRKIPAAEAWRPIDQGNCPLVKKS
jgi:branched-chain amino acid transport system substrate-binding protein